MTRTQKKKREKENKAGKLIMPMVTLDTYHKTKPLLVDRAMTNYDSSIITARSKQGVARMVAHLPDCLLVMPVQRWKMSLITDTCSIHYSLEWQKVLLFYMALNFADFHRATSCLSHGLGWDSPLPDDFVRFIGEVHIKPAQPLVIAPDYQIVAWKNEHGTLASIKEESSKH